MPGVPNLQDQMPDAQRWNWCHNNKSKVHNKCDVLESPWAVGKLSSTEPIPGAKKVGVHCLMGSGALPLTKANSERFSNHKSVMWILSANCTLAAYINSEMKHCKFLVTRSRMIGMWMVALFTQSNPSSLTGRFLLPQTQTSPHPQMRADMSYQVGQPPRIQGRSSHSQCNWQPTYALESLGSRCSLDQGLQCPGSLMLDGCDVF